VRPTLCTPLSFRFIALVLPSAGGPLAHSLIGLRVFSVLFLGAQVSVHAGAAMERVRAAGLLRTRGLIGGQWVDAYDGKTIEVCVLLPLRWK
jgi:hypothetical protein